MKRWMTAVFLLVFVLGMTACKQKNTYKVEIADNRRIENELKDSYVVKTYEATDPEDATETDELVVFVKHYEMSDGTWKTENHTYKYRLEKTGRVHNAASDTTFVFLSNIENITFEQMWKAAGLSSNLNDYFDADVARFVGMK